MNTPSRCIPRAQFQSNPPAPPALITHWPVGIEALLGRGVALVPGGQNPITPKPKTNLQHAHAPGAKFMIEANSMTTLIL